jgi:uncharacterized OB-fold protein
VADAATPTTPAAAAASGRVLPDRWTLPRLDEHNRRFFTSGALVLQRCAACHGVHHPPQEVCPDCQGLEFEYEEVDGTGVVVSFTEVHHAVHAALAGAVPYHVVLVELAGHPGVRIVGNLVGAAPAGVRVGMAVRCTWATVDPGGGRPVVTLPQWAAEEG